MKDIYFVKYSCKDAQQPLSRKHYNCSLEIDNDQTEYWEFTNEIINAERLHSEENVTIDFMIKVGETE